jgi:hypothetical protein
MAVSPWENQTTLKCVTMPRVICIWIRKNNTKVYRADSLIAQQSLQQNSDKVKVFAHGLYSSIRTFSKQAFLLVSIQHFP